MGFTLDSPAFAAGGSIPRRHTGDGEDVSPVLKWSALPAGTKELALIMDDPDAPTAEAWVHWVIYKIPADAGRLAEVASEEEELPEPEGVLQGLNSWNSIGYRGPAPPKGHGVHHYHFRLYALDEPLSIEAGLDKHALLEAMDGHILGETELIGTYQR